MRWLRQKPGAEAESTRRRGPKRPRAAPWWRHRMARLGAAALLITGLGAVAVGVWQARLPHRLAAEARLAFVAATADIGFRVEDILVVGRRETTRDELRQALGVGHDDPILFVDLNVVRERLLALPWVASAAVERQLPQTLIVRVVERRPLALWQQNGAFALIDTTGAVIQREKLGRFADLLVVVGDGAPEEAARLTAILETQPELRRRVAAAVRVGGRRWNLRLNDGVDVLLPEQEAAEAWARLAEYQQRHGLLDRPVRIVDLRNPQRLTIRTEPEAVPEDGDPLTGRET